VLVHVLLVKWNRHATAASIDEARSRFLDLASKVPGIEGAHWGTTGGGRSEEYDAGVVLLARDRTAFDAYLRHPDHAPLAAAMNRIVSKFAAANLTSSSAPLRSA
jgi:hypothetical protein